MMASALTIREQIQQGNLVSESLESLPRSSNVEGYRDYRGIPVVGVWTWMPELDLGLTVEMDQSEAYADFANFRFNLLTISAITTLLAIGATLFTLLVGQRANRSLSQARDNLEDRVEQRTNELSQAYEVISDSINYASTIQRAMLPDESSLTECIQGLFHHLAAEGCRRR